MIGLISFLSINTITLADNEQLKSKKLELAATLHPAIDTCHYGLSPILSYDSKYLLTRPLYCNPSSIELFDLKTGKLLKTFNNANFACFSPDGRYVVIMYPEYMHLLEMPSGHCIKTFDNLYLPIPSWSKDSKYLILSESAYFDNYINKQLLYNLQTEETIELDTSTFVFSGYQPIMNP